MSSIFCSNSTEAFLARYSEPGQQRWWEEGCVPDELDGGSANLSSLFSSSSSRFSLNDWISFSISFHSTAYSPGHSMVHRISIIVIKIRGKTSEERFSKISSRESQNYFSAPRWTDQSSSQSANRSIDRVRLWPNHPPRIVFGLRHTDTPPPIFITAFFEQESFLGSHYFVSVTISVGATNSANTVIYIVFK